MDKAKSVNSRPGATTVRCALYTRKSSEEGLEQDFNSLDAQRESCAAYVLSQRQHGWVVLGTPYDDGGFSGGTLMRPAMQRLLADVKTGKVDTVVVYKVDRLTRSLADFAKIIEVFDAHNVSFVSVTQHFNTTTSMGRLTLNVLLSFAQFEREVTGERIRDKIAASKKKGMWMGGTVPLGYDAVQGKLIVNAPEAETVRHIFRRYAALGSVQALQEELVTSGVRSKRRVAKNGHERGGNPLARGVLYRLLQNRLYRGEVCHRGHIYPGEHAGIVDLELWGRVQRRLEANRVDRHTGTTAQHPSLLAGLLFDATGERMTPSHAVKNAKRYRYYVSRSLTIRAKGEAGQGQRIPAADIERIVSERIHRLVADRSAVYAAILPHCPELHQQQQALARAEQLVQRWPDLAPSELRSILVALIERVEVHLDHVIIQVVPARLAGWLSDTPASAVVPPDSQPQERLTLSVQARHQRVGMETRILLESAGQTDRSRKPDPTLVKLIVKAHGLMDKLLAAPGTDLKTLAEAEGFGSSYFTRLMRLTFLAPDIVQAILEGRQPSTLTANQLLRDTRFPLDWAEQRRHLGFR